MGFQRYRVIVAMVSDGITESRFIMPMKASNTLCREDVVL